MSGSYGLQKYCWVEYLAPADGMHVMAGTSILLIIMII